MGSGIATLVALGLLAYLAASWVGVGDDPEPGRGGAFGRRLRHVLDTLHDAAPLLLAVIWIAYGLMHLLTPLPSARTGAEQAPNSAALQVPLALQQYLVPIWYGSGAFEIAMGLLVVQAKWRRWSLLAQLVMLIACTPFVVHILGSDSALQDLLSGLSPALGRVVLVTHNILLFLWVARVYRDELKRLATERLPASGRAKTADDAELGSQRPGAAVDVAKPTLRPVTIVALVMLAANVAGCLVIGVAPWRSGALLLWAMGSLATGALVGFLFGVPRWVAAKGKAASVDRTRYKPNTNIEKLSDWLTKTLVGVGLVQLHELGPTLNRVGAVLAAGLTLRDPTRVLAPGAAHAFATGLVAYFLVAGVIQGFLLTRMFITRAWNADGS